jgi:putative NIF3 family GTP cyclohydrolase 1 type 2
VNLDEVVAALDAEFRVHAAADDDWSAVFARCYAEPYWRTYAEPDYDRRWNGLMVRGGSEVEQARTCVFPSDEIVDGLEPRTLLFSEHPLDFADRPGFEALARESFEALREKECSFYHVHLPLDLHPTLAPSRLLAGGLGLDGLRVRGTLAVGDSPLSLQGLIARLQDFLGLDIPVHVLLRADEHAGRVAVAAGRGGRPELLQEALDLGAATYVTGNAGTYSDVEEVQELNRRFRTLAERAQISVIDATHYGTERPAQLRMVEWFRRRGLPARFAENGPK